MASASTLAKIREAVTALPAEKQWQVVDDPPPPVPGLAATTSAPARGLGGKPGPKGPVPPLDIPKLLAEQHAVATKEHQARIDELKSSLVPPGAAAPTGEDEAPPRPLAPTAAKAVDWRNRWGKNWLCSVANQGGAGSCWAFAATALVETMVRIEHYLWSKRSEGDLRDGCGSTWAANWGAPGDKIYFYQGGDAGGALRWAAAHGGVADYQCVPWVEDSPSWRFTMDRAGRTTRIPQPTGLASNDVAAQKVWIDAVGPLAAFFNCYDDFFQGYKGGVYHKTANTRLAGGHVVLIVGYDDDAKCWICRNSWGPGFGEAGYFRIGYGECDIDNSTKWGLKGVSPDPMARRRLHNGCFYQSSNGAAHRNFEVIKSDSQIWHIWRDGGSFAWGKGEVPVAKDLLPTIGWPALTSTTYNRNFEMLFWDAKNNLTHYVKDQKTGQWKGMGSFGDGQIAGFPGFIQSSINCPGNLHAVVAQKDGKMHQYLRGLEIDDWGHTGSAWSPPWDFGTFGSGVLMTGPSLLQANVGRNGNFYLVCVLKSGKLQLWWNDLDALGDPWQQGEIFGSGYGWTPPCMIQSQGSSDTAVGNFELVIASGGQIHHWYRENRGLSPTNPPEVGKPKVGNGQWYRTASFGTNIMHVWGLLESSFHSNLELIAETSDHKMQHWYRDTADMQWYGGTLDETKMAT